MHELLVTQSIVTEILKKTKKPKRIVVDIGTLTTYKKEPILMYFEVLKEDVPEIKNAVLEVNEVRGKIMCDTCKQESFVDSPLLLLCPHCDNASNTRVVDGGEMIIKSVDVLED